MKLSIKKIKPNAIIPSYAHQGDAGMDLYTCKEVIIPPKKKMIVSTGIAMEIPEGYVGLIWDKSGLAVHHGITVLAGVIDAGYRGEIGVPIFNTSNVAYTFEAGDKMAQMLIQSIEIPTLVEVDELSDTDRGTKGFGSTGKK